MPDFKQVRMSDTTPEEMEQSRLQTICLHRLNQSEPYSLEQQALLEELFANQLPEGAHVMPPLSGVCFDRVRLEKGVFVNSGALMMARGGITIEAGAMLAANVSLLTNNHDLYDRDVLLCSPITIKEGAWIGAGVTIMPGITVGRWAIVGAASVVTHNVPDYAVAVGNPARVIRTLDASKFPPAKE
ncbi:MAG: galactoside O-acetyltransferase [Clostridia bacterium]|nr:galactoside O-acetyltransferase [Clostridia bacterium]